LLRLENQPDEALQIWRHTPQIVPENSRKARQVEALILDTERSLLKRAAPQ
jgi:hypothetical protein